MLKGVLAPKYHKRMREHEQAFDWETEREKRARYKGKTLKCILERERETERGEMLGSISAQDAQS